MGDILFVSIVVSAFVTGCNAQGRAIPIQAENIVTTKVQSVNPSLVYDGSNFLVNVAATYARCGEADDSRMFDTGQQTHDGKSIQAIVDSVPGDGHDTVALIGYIEEVLGQWLNNTLFVRQIRHAQKFGCSVRPACHDSAIFACLFAPGYFEDAVSQESAFISIKPNSKTWWAKQITPYLYTAGHLTDTQMKQAADEGFKTIVSMFLAPSNYSIGEEMSYDTELTRSVAEEIGVHYDVLLNSGGNWASPEPTRRFIEIFDNAPKPILLHCMVAHSASLAALNFLVNKTRSDPDFEPKLNSARLYEMASLLGYYLNTTDEKRTIAEISGEDFVVHPPEPPYSLNTWFTNDLWGIKPVYRNLYVAGQIKANYMPRMRDAGYEILINLRAGVESDGEPSQEEVTLINIKDNTGTYTEGGRQNFQRLLETRINSSRTNNYPGFGSNVNFQSRNPLEYGDDVGYNEALERISVTSANLTYIHTPITGNFDIDIWLKYKDQWLEAARSGKAVLIHSGGSFRAAISALLTAGYQYDLSSDWAIQRAAELGYHLQAGGYTDRMQLLRDVLI